MKSTQKNARTSFSLIMTIAVICLMTAVIIPGVMGAELDVNLGSAQPFTILSYSGITDASPGTSVISGDIGSSPITGASMNTITCTEMNGYNIYGVDAGLVLPCYKGTPADKTTVDGAFADSVTAYGDAAGRTTAPVTELGGGNIGGLTLAPGLYKWTTAVNVGPGTTLYFDAAGNPNAVWILQTTGTLTMAANTHMVLLNGAKADHIYWQIAGIPGANIGTGAHAEGNILAAGAINLLSGASLNGRAFSQAAAAGVTLSGNTIVRPDLVPAPVVITPPTVSSAVTNVTGNKIIITFDKAMSSPVGKETEFTYKIGAGLDQPFDSAALNATSNTRIDLTTFGTQIAAGDIVTISYTAGTVTSADTGALATFTPQAVTNTLPAAPTFVSSVTNVTGNKIIVTFNKAMASPVGTEGQFAYQIGAGAAQPFSAAALNVTNNKAFDLTTSGTQIASGDIVTVSYTAGTVTSADTGILATFTPQTVNNAVIAGIIPPTVASATTNVTGNKIIITFDKVMANPSGKEGQFAYQIGGGIDLAFSAAALNATDNKAIDLTTAGTQIAPGDIVTVSYIAGTVTAADTGVLAAFSTQAVSNAVVAGIAAPTVTSAATNATGTMITITFDKVMANPAGNAGAFKYQIGGGADQPFSAAALNATDNKAIDLTTFGTSIAYGDVVTVNYTAGTVTAADTGVLATFTGQAVANTMPAPPVVTAISPASGLITGGETITITGTGLLGATAVTFDTIAVIPMTNTGTVITASAPVHPAGIVNITVTTPVGTSANSSANGYSYGIPGSSALDLGSADNFVILAKSGISTTGSTLIYGDIGVSPIAASGITGFNLVADASNQFSKSSLVNGNVYASNYAVPTPTTMTTAIGDMEAAYNDAAGRTLPDHTELGAGNIGGMTLAPGLYKWSSGVTIPTDVTLAGGPNDVWIFQIAQGLVISSDKHVILSGGAQAKNIYWQVAGQTTLGSDSVFEGTILDKTAIVFDSGAALNGKALAQTEVTLIGNNVNVPAVVTPVITVAPIVYAPNGGSGEPATGTSAGTANTATGAGNLLAPPGQLSPSLPSSNTPVSGSGLLASTPLIVDFSGMTGVTVGWTTQIGDNPAPNAEITTAIQPTADQSTLDAITAALHTGGLDLGSTAYGMVIQRNGVPTYGPTTVTMTISQDWVDRNGGKDSMRIVSIADDGTVEVLHTWFSGYDPYSGYLTFEATSPQNGLGTSYWLVSVNPYTPAAPTAAPVTVQKAPTQAPVTSTTPVAPASGVPLMMTIGGILAALVIVGIAAMTIIRRNK